MSRERLLGPALHPRVVQEAALLVPLRARQVQPDGGPAQIDAVKANTNMVTMIIFVGIIVDDRLLASMKSMDEAPIDVCDLYNIVSLFISSIIHSFFLFFLSFFFFFFSLPFHLLEFFSKGGGRYLRVAIESGYSNSKICVSDIDQIPSRRLRHQIQERRHFFSLSISEERERRRDTYRSSISVLCNIVSSTTQIIRGQRAQK